MRKVYEVENKFNQLQITEPINAKPTGQVLVDSDAFAFIYIVEENEQYSYLTFGEAVWPNLVELLEKEQNPSIEMNGELVELEGFYDELTYLLFNIEGNSNYGDEFVERVEKAFAKILGQSVL